MWEAKSIGGMGRGMIEGEGGTEQEQGHDLAA